MKTKKEIKEKIRHFKEYWDLYPSSQYEKNKIKIDILTGIYNEINTSLDCLKDLLFRHNTNNFSDDIWGSSLKEILEWLFEDAPLDFSLSPSDTEYESDFYWQSFNACIDLKKEDKRRKELKKYLIEEIKEECPYSPKTTIYRRWIEDTLINRVNEILVKELSQGLFFNENFIPPCYRPSWIDSEAVENEFRYVQECLKSNPNFSADEYFKEQRKQYKTIKNEYREIAKKIYSLYIERIKDVEIKNPANVCQLVKDIMEGLGV